MVDDLVQAIQAVSDAQPAYPDSQPLLKAMGQLRGVTEARGMTDAQRMTIAREAFRTGVMAYRIRLVDEI